MFKNIIKIYLLKKMPPISHKKNEKKSINKFFLININNKYE